MDDSAAVLIDVVRCLERDVRRELRRNSTCASSMLPQHWDFFCLVPKRNEMEENFEDLQGHSSG